MRSFLDEMARKNSEQNPRISAYQQIIDSGYNTKDYFFTFTHLKKVGIKPTSNFDTPNGIYTYPALEIIPMIHGNMSNVPFADKAPYIHVLKKKGSGIVDPVESYSSGNLKADIKKISRMIKSHKDYNENVEKHVANVIYDAIKGAFTDKPISKIWNITKELSADPLFSNLMGYGGVKTSDYRDWYAKHIRLKEVDRGKYKRRNRNEQIPIFQARGGVRYNSQGWNNLLRNLGYNGFVDRQGLGVIHQNEPTQAVFLTTKAFKVVDLILNKSYERVHMKSEYEDNIKSFAEVGNEVVITDSLTHTQEEVFNELVKGKIYNCKINFFNNNVYIDGEGVGVLDKVDLKGTSIHITNTNISGGAYYDLSEMTKCIIEGGVFSTIKFSDPDIVGGHFKNCTIYDLDVVSNAVIQDNVNKLSQVVFFKCGLSGNHMTDCAYTQCDIRRSTINGRKAPVIFNKDSATYMNVNEMYNVRINDGRVEACKIRSSVITGGDFERCRFMDTEILGGKFRGVKNVFDTDVKIAKGVKVN